MQAGRAFVVMPFGSRPGADGVTIDFDRVFSDYLRPAIEAAGLRPHRADADRRGGSIHNDMFQELLLAELVVADLTVDNPNVWYEIGVRHALRASGAVLTFANRDRLPFDLNGQRMVPYALERGALVPGRLEADRAALTEAIVATLGAWRARKASPVYATLPNLREPDWKSLKVGDVNEYWEALEAWQARIAVARRKERPGDILTLAEETPNRLLAFEALRGAGEALLHLNRPRYALAVLGRARALDPEDARTRQQEAIALGRVGRDAEAAEGLRKLADEQAAAGQPSGETLGLLARTRKAQWRQLWEAARAQGAEPLKAARDTGTALALAADAYLAAFRAAPADHYPGINALTLGRVWEHVTGRRRKTDLDLLAGGVRWAIEAGGTAAPDYWTLASRAELALVQDDRDAALEDYEAAAALATDARNRFALDSTLQQLRFLESLGFRAELAGEAAEGLARALAQLDALAGAAPQGSARPARVVLFSGHMVDRPDRATPRFPAARADAAAVRIGAELDGLGVMAGDLGIAQAACGGDLLFARACLARGMRLWVMLPQAESAFLAASVGWAGRRWQDDYDAVRAHPLVSLRLLPEELGPAPDGVDPYERGNRWMLHTALSQGLDRVSFVTLWDGADGDGQGGTAHMARLVRELTGREPVLIDPATLE